MEARLMNIGQFNCRIVGIAIAGRSCEGTWNPSVVLSQQLGGLV